MRGLLLKPQVYVDRSQLATMLGISRQRLAVLEDKGKLPRPDAVAGERPLWLMETAQAFVEERKRQLGGE